MRATNLSPVAWPGARSIFALILVLTSATAADARLFWQTYGSTTATSDGCGCTWNWNQDYFVPRYPSSCRYDLFGPCKTSRTTSPACKWCHPIHSGYCGAYGPCHYCRRNHVYQAYCGCTPLTLCHRRAARSSCGTSCQLQAGGGDCCGMPGYYLAEAPLAGEMMPLPNVEGFGLNILGSIPIEGNELFGSEDLSLLEDDLTGKKILIGPQTIVPAKPLPLLGKPQQDTLTAPLPSGQ